jgi:hypothetical protein
VTLTPENVALFGYLMALVLAPFVSGLLIVQGLGERHQRWVAWPIAGLMLALWAPLVYGAPAILPPLM